MPTTANWVNPQKTIYIIRYIGDWTISEMYSTFSNSNLAIWNVEQNVVMLIDFTDSYSVPNSLLSSVRSVQQKLPHNLIFTILFGGDMFLELMSETIKKIYIRDDTVRYVESYEVALKLAYQQLEQSNDSSLFG